jgi:polyferredoxin
MDHQIVKRLLIVLLIGLGILFLIYSSYEKPKAREDFLGRSVRIQGIIIIIAILITAIILLLR